jgi:tetratricopeptide (TPR) repeat protein
LFSALLANSAVGGFVLANDQRLFPEVFMRHYASLLLLSFLLISSSANSQTTLGLNATQLFQKGMNAITGSTTSRNDLNALDYFRRSAELGYAPAQVVMGYFYDTGSIVAAEPEQAVTWYKKAAAQDDSLGDWLLGRLYLVGSSVPRDLNQAANACQKAADQGDPFGQYLLGAIKLERNEYAKAADWFRKAALQGLPQAQQQLGLLLKRGQGVSTDKFEAYVWLLVSFDTGNQSVVNDLQELEGQLGSTQLEQAKTKARELEQTVNRSVMAHGCTGWSGEFSPVPTPPPVDVQRFCR